MFAEETPEPIDPRYETAVTFAVQEAKHGNPGPLNGLGDLKEQIADASSSLAGSRTEWEWREGFRDDGRWVMKGSW